MIEPAIPDCPREAEVLEAVAFGRWPAHVDRQLAAHVAACASCAEVAEIARLLREDRDGLGREAQLPSAGIVWWRATIRARSEAARTAMQPISALQGIAGACAVGLAGGLVTMAWRSIRWTDRLGDVVARFAVSRSDVASLPAVSVTLALPIVLAVAACLVLAPLALYITLADD